VPVVVEIYTKTFCPYCWRAKSLLEAKGVDYKEITVDYGGELKQHMVQRARGRTTVPQIFIGEVHVGGCDDLIELDRAGKLDGLFAT
jgi:glutaredoxin 3